MIANIHAEESTASRCLDLIARCAPRMMKVGGGALCAEVGERGIKRGPASMSDEQRAKALVMGREGNLTATEIAHVLGSTQSAICNHLKRHGVRAPDGRRAGK